MFDSQEIIPQLAASESLFENNLRGLPSDPLAQYRAPYTVSPTQFPADAPRAVTPQQIIQGPPEPAPVSAERAYSDSHPPTAPERRDRVEPQKKTDDNEPSRFAIVAAELAILAVCMRIGFRKAPTPGTPTMAGDAFSVIKSATDRVLSRVGNSKVGSMFHSPSRQATVPTAKELAEGALGRKIVGPPEVHISTPRDQDPFNKFRVAN